MSEALARSWELHIQQRPGCVKIVHQRACENCKHHSGGVGMASFACGHPIRKRAYPPLWSSDRCGLWEPRRGYEGVAFCDAPEKEEGET